jgi:hypothetical protein
MEQEYIDVTPTWTTAAKLYAHVMTDGTTEGQRQAAKGIIEMGALLDKLIAEIKASKGASS